MGKIVKTLHEEFSAFVREFQADRGMVGPPKPNRLPSHTVTQPKQPADMKKAIAEYEAKLASHDWFYERSDDPTVYRKGKTELDALRIMQKYLDPDRKIWKRYEQS